jgi:hypothetical protein
MILGARIHTVSRKSLTTDRVIRFPGGREGEHDSQVDDEEHTLLTHLKFLYITHKSSNHVYQKALVLRYIHQPVNAVTQTMAVYATGCIKHIRIHSADKRQIFSIFKQLVEQVLCCKQLNVFPILKTWYRNVILKLNMKCFGTQQIQFTLYVSVRSPEMERHTFKQNKKTTAITYSATLLLHRC